MLHTDDIYRSRYQEYLLSTGEIADSRKTNWRLVEWEKVIGIRSHIRNNSYFVSCKNKPDFKFFMCFRWAGIEQISKKDKKQIKIWTVGYSDGEDCFLEDYDFKFGIKIKEYKKPLSMFKSHIHPRIINLGLLK